jgi:hypothetical protein
MYRSRSVVVVAVTFAALAAVAHADPTLRYGFGKPAIAM